MAMRSPAGFISAFFDPLKNPDAPTSPAATAGDASASVTFTAPANVGGSAITQYYAVSNPSQFTGNAASSPVSVTGLTNGTAYTFNVWALNSYGPGVWSASTGSVTPNAQVGLFFRVSNADSRNNTINKITITTTGNATAFGALTNTYGYSGSCSSSTRWVVAGGDNSSGNVQNSILYGNFTTSGTTGTFGTLDTSKNGFAGLSNETRGLFAGGFDGSSPMCSISYVTIATTGNSTNFGNLTNQIRFNGGLASTTRGVSGGGTSTTNVIGYVTIATTGNATSFGQLTVARGYVGSCSNSTRGLFAGGESNSSGYPGVNTIDYITIATTGNATAFGSLTVARGTYGTGGWGLASTTRGVFGGAYDFNVIDYVTIASTGNATDFGDLNGTSAVGATASSVHGGL